MTERRTSRIHSRKEPQQARSADLVGAILDAAIQVLAKEGAQKFTTARVAERAGVSVGSLYQYFPNKAAILFRLQSDEWRRTSDMLGRTLDDRATPPMARLRVLTEAFLRSECEEAAIRIALDDAAPLYRDAPEALEARTRGQAAITRFFAECLPDAAPSKRALAADLVMTTLSRVGKRFSETPRSAQDMSAYAEAMADMFCAYLEKLAEPSFSAAKR